MRISNEKAKEIIKDECYVFNPLNFDRTTFINSALDQAIEALSNYDKFVKDLKNIYDEIWNVDIPSPGDSPEYKEHHEQMKNLMSIVQNYIDKWENYTK